MPIPPHRGPTNSCVFSSLLRFTGLFNGTCPFLLTYTEPRFFIRPGSGLSVTLGVYEIDSAVEASDAASGFLSGDLSREVLCAVDLESANGTVA